MSEPDNQQGKNRNIQFLRGLAIILVLFAHGSVMLVGEEAVYWDSVLQHILPGVGVDLFFLISGYLMGVTFLRKQRQFDLIAVYGFYKKRIRRVLIPTWFWAAAVVLLGLLDLIDGSPAYGMQAIVGIASSAAFFLANVYNALHETDFGYFWSIALEVQFYLFFPLLLLVGRYFWWAVIAILLWLSFASPFSPEWLFRANALFAGLLIWKLSTLEPFRLAEQEINQLSVPSRAFISVAAVLCAAVVASTWRTWRRFAGRPPRSSWRCASSSTPFPMTWCSVRCRVRSRRLATCLSRCTCATSQRGSLRCTGWRTSRWYPAF
ncbi:acyltransferase family protein [Stutzerimonas marianensis]